RRLELSCLSAETTPTRQQVAPLAELLHDAVVRVRHVDVLLAVDTDADRRRELPGAAARLTPLVQEHAAGAEAPDRGARAVGDADVDAAIRAAADRERALELAGAGGADRELEQEGALAREVLHSVVEAVDDVDRVVGRDGEVDRRMEFAVAAAGVPPTADVGAG